MSDGVRTFLTAVVVVLGILICLCATLLLAGMFHLRFRS